MKKVTLIALVASLSINALAQDTKFYGRMTLTHAKELLKDAPKGEVKIIDNNGKEAIVYMTPEASERLHHRILTHGPGYFFEGSKEQALENLHNKQLNIYKDQVVNFTITEDKLVNAALDVAKVENLEKHIQELEAYGTRFHNTREGRKAADDLKAKWEGFVSQYNRKDDISVEFFKHSAFNTQMPSIILTIKGTDAPDEIVVIGGHLDSTVNEGPKSNAPGADDNASGTATITEALRAILEIGFKPKRTVQFIAYSAEEVGLLGSKEIAEKYVREKKNVISALQMDMTNVKDSGKDIYLMIKRGPRDPDISPELNKFLKELMDHYQSSGKRKITYGETACGYACSDHASWADNGFKAAFPFESDFKDLNFDRIHTTNDNFKASDNSADHALKFCNLSIEYVIEAAKGQALSVDEFSLEGYDVKFLKNALRYNVDNSASPITSISIYNVEGKNVGTHAISKKSGKIALKNLSSGAYVATFKLSNNKSFSKKFVKN